MEPNEDIPQLKKNIPAIVLASVLVAALAAGGGVFAYQHSKEVKSQQDLQSQVDALKAQLAASPSPIPAPTAVATATPSATQVTTAATPSATPIALLTAAQLMNFTYRDMNGVSRTLKNGIVQYPATGTTGSLGITQDYGPINGDVDGDGTPDTLIILGDNEGGTGYWNILAAVLDKKGLPVLGGEAVILNDRATIKSVTISKGIITVKGMEHGPDQSEADEPNQPKTETYKLVGGKLVLQ